MSACVHAAVWSAICGQTVKPSPRSPASSWLAGSRPLTKPPSVDCIANVAAPAAVVVVVVAGITVAAAAENDCC